MYVQLKTMARLSTDRSKTYIAMEGVLKSGKAKAIGVSNFSRREIERILEKATTKPAVHQMELHPWLQQQAFFDFHQTHGIHVTQYSPFGNSNEIYGSREQHGLLVNDETLVEIGKKYGKSSNQVALGMCATFSFEMVFLELINLCSLGYLTWSFRDPEIKVARANHTKL